MWCEVIRFSLVLLLPWRSNYSACGVLTNQNHILMQLGNRSKSSNHWFIVIKFGGFRIKHFKRLKLLWNILLCVLHIKENQQLPEYVALVWMSHWSLNTDPMSCVWIGYFSRLWQLGGQAYRSPPGQTAAPLSSSSPLTEELCAAATSPECQHSCNYITSSVRFSTPPLAFTYVLSSP